MKKQFIGICQLTFALASIPNYGPVSFQHYCQTGTYYFSTSYYTRTYEDAEAACKSYNCDLIIEWEGPLGKATKKGWDIGKIGDKTCKQNPKMTAKIRWQKSDNVYRNDSQNSHNGLS